MTIGQAPATGLRRWCGRDQPGGIAAVRRRMLGQSRLLPVAPVGGFTAYWLSWIVMSERIVRAFDEDLAELRSLIEHHGGRGARQVGAAGDALQRYDANLAEQAVRKDITVDGLFRDIEEKAFRMIARRQPVAGDLRAIMASIKIAADLERIGDLAKKRRSGLPPWQTTARIWQLQCFPSATSREAELQPCSCRLQAQDTAARFPSGSAMRNLTSSTTPSSGNS